MCPNVDAFMSLLTKNLTPSSSRNLGSFTWRIAVTGVLAGVTKLPRCLNLR